MSEYKKVATTRFGLTETIEEGQTKQVGKWKITDKSWITRGTDPTNTQVYNLHGMNRDIRIMEFQNDWYIWPVSGHGGRQGPYTTRQITQLLQDLGAPSIETIERTFHPSMNEQTKGPSNKSGHGLARDGEINQNKSQQQPQQQQQSMGGAGMAQPPVQPVSGEPNKKEDEFTKDIKNLNKPSVNPKSPLGAVVAKAFDQPAEDPEKEGEKPKEKPVTEPKAEAQKPKSRGPYRAGDMSVSKWSPAFAHQVKIARQTLKASPLMARVMGGPTPEEARTFLAQHGLHEAFVSVSRFTLPTAKLIDLARTYGGQASETMGDYILFDFESESNSEQFRKKIRSLDKGADLGEARINEASFEAHALGKGWSYSSIVSAPNKAAAEKMFRQEKRFRRSARQNNDDWRSVEVVVSPTTQAAWKAGSPKPPQMPKLTRQRFQKMTHAESVEPRGKTNKKGELVAYPHTEAEHTEWFIKKLVAAAKDNPNHPLAIAIRQGWPKDKVLGLLASTWAMMRKDGEQAYVALTQPGALSRKGIHEATDLEPIAGTADASVPAVAIAAAAQQEECPIGKHIAREDGLFTSRNKKGDVRHFTSEKLAQEYAMTEGKIRVFEAFRVGDKVRKRSGTTGGIVAHVEPTPDGQQVVMVQIHGTKGEENQLPYLSSMLVKEDKNTFKSPKGDAFFKAIKKGAKKSTEKGMSPQDALAKFNADRLKKKETKKEATLPTKEPPHPSRVTTTGGKYHVTGVQPTERDIEKDAELHGWTCYGCGKRGSAREGELCKKCQKNPNVPKNKQEATMKPEEPQSDFDHDDFGRDHFDVDGFDRRDRLPQKGIKKSVKKEARGILPSTFEERKMKPGTIRPPDKGTSGYFLAKNMAGHVARFVYERWARDFAMSGAKIEKEVVKQTASNWRGQGCKNYDDARDVCLDKEEQTEANTPSLSHGGNTSSPADSGGTFLSKGELSPEDMTAIDGNWKEIMNYAGQAFKSKPYGVAMTLIVKYIQRRGVSNKNAPKVADTIAKMSGMDTDPVSMIVPKVLPRITQEPNVKGSGFYFGGHPGPFGPV